MKKRKEKEARRKAEEEKEINFPSEIENTDSSIQTTTLKDITFSDDLNFAYFELWGNFYGKHFEIKNIKDFYCKLVFIFIEKYPDCLTYSKNQLSLEKDNFILRLYKEKYFSSFALKFGYIRNIFEDWFLYINFPLCELEHKIKKIVSAMELTDQEVVLGYYPNEPVEEETEEPVEEETEEPAEELEEEPAEIENTDSNIQKTTLRDITFSRDIKLAYCEIFGKKYNIKIERDLYQLLVKLFVEKHPNSLIYEDDKIIVYDKIKLYKYSYILNNRKQLNIETRFRHIFEDWYLDVDRVISTLEDRIRRCVFALGLFEDEVIIGYYSNNAVYYQPKQIKEPQQIKYTQKIKPPIFLNSNIQIVNLRDITFTKELKLAYFEVLGKRYEIKNTRDIIQELVKLFIEKYPNLCRYENNHFVLERYNFGIKLYRKEEYAHRPEFLRHILEDWYLYVNYNISVFEEQIRKIVFAMDIPEDEVIIGYYPNNAVSFPTAEVKEKQVNYTPVKTKHEQPKEDMLLFSSDLKKVKNKFFDYLLNVKNFEEVKAKNYVLAFNFYCYSNNISFSLNNVAYFEEQIANDELLSSNERIEQEKFSLFFLIL